MTRRKTTWGMVALAVVVCLAAACGGGGHGAAAERAARAESATGDILIGAAGPMTGDLAQFGQSMLHGINLAVDEINAAGGVNGRRFRVEVGDDRANASEGTLVAQRFAGNLDLVAVIGHFNSGISIPTSAIYDRFGLVQITPASTNPKYTQQGFRRTFRNIPNDDENGRQLGDFIGRQGWKRIVIYFANNAYGKGFADVVEARAKELGVAVLDRQAYDPDRDEEFRPVLTRWKSLEFDAVVLAGENPKGAIIISHARDVGITQPFCGGDGIASNELWKIGGAAAEGTYVTSYFHPSDERPEVVAFMKAFQAQYGQEPDVWAAQSYDAVKVLAEAIRAAGSTNPDKIAAALHAVRGWQGVTGSHTFNEAGDVVGKKVLVTVVKDGAFALVPAPAEPAPAAGSSAPASTEAPRG